MRYPSLGPTHPAFMRLAASGIGRGSDLGIVNASVLHTKRLFTCLTYEEFERIGIRTTDPLTYITILYDVPKERGGERGVAEGEVGWVGSSGVRDTFLAYRKIRGGTYFVPRLHIFIF